jgi:hypothetical protein
VPNVGVFEWPHEVGAIKKVEWGRLTGLSLWLQESSPGGYLRESLSPSNEPK